MAICNGCGGVVGRDCFNPQECEWIAHEQERQYMMEQAQAAAAEAVADAIPPGVPMRDYFAAKILPVIYTTAMQEAREGSGLFQHEDWRIGIALDAYKMADAMLKAREGK